MTRRPTLQRDSAPSRQGRNVEILTPADPGPDPLPALDDGRQRPAAGRIGNRLSDRDAGEPQVDISAALAADLAALTEALDTPGIDLETELRAFAADVKIAVASFTAMTVTIAVDGLEVSFVVHDGARTTPATSLLIPLAARTPTVAVSTLLLFAATPGAFVDLAADLSHALGIDLPCLVIDCHLEPPGDAAPMTGWSEHATVNQAIGVLIDRGHTPESARRELHRLAAMDHGDTHAAAEAVILSAQGRPPETG